MLGLPRLHSGITRLRLVKQFRGQSVKETVYLFTSSNVRESDRLLEVEARLKLPHSETTYCQARFVASAQLTKRLG
jgi:hypothetical protein